MHGGACRPEDDDTLTHLSRALALENVPGAVSLLAAHPTAAAGLRLPLHGLAATRLDKFAGRPAALAAFVAVAAKDLVPALVRGGAHTLAEADPATGNTCLHVLAANPTLGPVTAPASDLFFGSGVFDASSIQAVLHTRNLRGDTPLDIATRRRGIRFSNGWGSGLGLSLSRPLVYSGRGFGFLDADDGEDGDGYADADGDVPTPPSHLRFGTFMFAAVSAQSTTTDSLGGVHADALFYELLWEKHVPGLTRMLDSDGFTLPPRTLEVLGTVDYASYPESPYGPDAGPSMLRILDRVGALLQPAHFHQDPLYLHRFFRHPGADVPALQVLWPPGASRHCTRCLLTPDARGNTALHVLASVHDRGDFPARVFEETRWWTGATNTDGDTVLGCAVRVQPDSRLNTAYVQCLPRLVDVLLRAAQAEGGPEGFQGLEGPATNGYKRLLEAGRSLSTSCTAATRAALSACLAMVVAAGAKADVHDVLASCPELVTKQVARGLLRARPARKPLDFVTAMEACPADGLQVLLEGGPCAPCRTHAATNLLVTSTHDDTDALYSKMEVLRAHGVDVCSDAVLQEFVKSWTETRDAVELLKAMVRDRQGRSRNGPTLVAAATRANKSLFVGALQAGDSHHQRQYRHPAPPSPDAVSVFSDLSDDDDDDDDDDGKDAQTPAASQM